MPPDLITTLRTQGPVQAGKLGALLGVSRPTLSRAVQAAGDEVIARGAARRRTYAARRALRGSIAPLPLYRIDKAGMPHEIARLDLVYPDGTAVEFATDFGWPLDDEMRDGWFEGLPYPLQDMRPQGFLGRNFARHYAAVLQVNEDPASWSDDDVLHALTVLGMDAPGDLVVGEAACRLWLEQVERTRAGAAPAGLRDEDLAAAYPELAATALAHGVAWSSAGGEFPKFTAMRQTDDGAQQHVLVKFSGSDDSPGTRRWADLLVCEHLAGRTLQEQLGIAAANSRVSASAGRVFLEVDRFDRHGALGRSAVVTWFTLNATFLGVSGRAWAEATRALAQRAWLADDDVARIQRVWLFGQLIGNTDMHDSNLAFLPHQQDGAAGLRLAPIFDMLPMTYAPMRGVELPPRTYAPKLPLPSEAQAWQDAACAAVSFWETAAGDTRISSAFRALCEDNAKQLRKLLG